MKNQAAKTQARTVDAKRKVLNCATKLVAEGGFEAAQMAVISVASGVSIGSIYHHFGSKEGIFVELIRSADEATRDRFAALDLAGKSFDERLYQLIWATCLHVTCNSGLYHAMTARQNTAPEIWEPFLQLRADNEVLMQECLGPDLEAQGYRDVAMRIRMMHQAVIGILMHATTYKSGPIMQGDRDLVDQVYDLARNVVLGQFNTRKKAND